MNKKIILFLASCLLLSGCGSTLTSSEEIPSTEHSLSEYSPDEIFYADCNETPDRDFYTAFSGPVGEVSVKEPINLRMFVGRNEREECYVDRYEGQTIYLMEILSFNYWDKRGNDYSISKNYFAAKIALPNLMDEKYKVTAYPGYEGFELTEYIDITLDLNDYLDYFTDIPMRKINTSSTDSSKTEVYPVDLDYVELKIYPYICSVNDDQMSDKITAEDKLGETRTSQEFINYPEIVLKENTYTFLLDEPKQNWYC